MDFELKCADNLKLDMASLTENNLKAHAQASGDRMAALLERTQMLSELLGQVNDALGDESDTASRPSSKRGPARPPTNPLAARLPSSRPHSTRPQSTEPPSTASQQPGRPGSSQRLASAAPAVNGAQPPPMLRLTAGYEGSKPSPMDRFLQSSGVQTSKPPAGHDGPGEEQLQLYDEGRRVADHTYNRGASLSNDENGLPGGAPRYGAPRLYDENGPVKLVRYTGRQTAFGQMQKLRRNPNARASQSSVGGVVFGGGEA